MKKSNYDSVRAWRHNNKLKMVQGFGSKCACCGLEDHPVCYDFHHLDPKEKDFTVTQKIRSWASAVKEAQKCCMLCAHCHRKVHAGMLTVPDDAPRFDEARITAVGATDECPECNGSKPLHQVTCSKQCHGKRTIKLNMIARTGVDWDEIDLKLLWETYHSGYAIAKFLGINAGTVRARLKKSGLTNGAP